MAFDHSTRNRLQRFVSNARSLLTEEFTRQLQQDYGLDPKAGEVADLSKLDHLDDSRLETARVLREILAHYLASEMASIGKKSQQDVLGRIVREQAFTVLNRLVALRMMESRGLLIESVANGYQSKGFLLYERLAGHALGETGDAYRCYLFSLFDEFALDLKVLFDRNASQGRLFPRESYLLELLELINSADMEMLWGEDETIGWIYQYFNSPEERKKMREEGKSGPRNSRELAVRNQFFTPRYVVEFLVDNSLGRQWFNLTGGQTSLADRCQYLLIKPEERKSTAAPTRLRDPRSIKLLDPACGSMHFGLYAFDIRQVYGEHGPMFKAQDTEQWQAAETRLREALIQFIHTARSSFQGRLFAQDALEGLRLIDLARERFDVVVMNPPFGAVSLGVKKELTKACPRSKNDLLAIFVERGLELLHAGGRLGAITSRTGFFLSSYRKWREEVVLGMAHPEVMADLGNGVMDDAMWRRQPIV